MRTFHFEFSGLDSSTFCFFILLPQHCRFDFLLRIDWRLLVFFCCFVGCLGRLLFVFGPFFWPIQVKPIQETLKGH